VQGLIDVHWLLVDVMSPRVTPEVTPFGPLKPSLQRQEVTDTPPPPDATMADRLVALAGQGEQAEPPRAALYFPEMHFSHAFIGEEPVLPVKPRSQEQSSGLAAPAGEPELTGHGTHACPVTLKLEG
jgi:hypothetical protein